MKMLDKVILGTAQLGFDYGINNQKGKPGRESAIELLCFAYDNNIRILDTAESYGDSQNIIGEYNRAYPDKKFEVITKFSNGHRNSEESIKDRILDNCRILNVSQLSAYMLHSFDSINGNSFVYDQIVSAKKNGLIGKIGISLYTNEEIEMIVQHYDEFDFVQLPFNILDNESKRKKTFDLIKSNGIELHARSIFLQGLFFKDPELLIEKLKPLSKYLEDLRSISYQKDMKISRLAMQYVFKKDYIDKVLIGVDNWQQLQSNISNIKNFDESSLHEIDEIKVLEEELLNPKSWN